jgi:hypothetical protein
MKENSFCPIQNALTLNLSAGPFISSMKRTEETTTYQANHVLIHIMGVEP